MNIFTKKFKKIYNAIKNIIKSFMKNKDSSKIIFYIKSLIIICIIQCVLVFIYNKDNEILSGATTEVFGLIFDVFLFGIFIAWYDLKVSKRNKLEHYLEEIEDSRGWNEKEASYRIFGLIKRLYKLGKNDIDLSYCYFEKVPFSKNVGVGFDFKTALLYGTSFVNCNLQGSNFSEVQQIYVTNIWEYINQFERIVNFKESSLRNSKFSAHSYTHLDFINCDMNRANFSDSTFSLGSFDKINFSTLKLENTKFLTCKFRNIDFENTNFENTEFNECEFLNCKNIDRITNNVKPIIQEDINENTIR